MKSAKKGTYIFLSIGVISSLFFCHSNADIYNMGFSIQRPQILAAVDRYPKPAKPSIEARYMKYYGSRRRNAEWQAGKILERMHQDAAEARKRERYAKTYLKLDQDGGFQELEPKQLLQEAHDIILGLELKKTVFFTNHASNYLALRGRFPQDKERFLEILQTAINGEMRLRPEFMRGL